MHADVVAIQEASPAHFESLSRLLPHGDFEPGERNTGVGIALRHAAAPGRLPLVWRDAIVARLEPADWPGLEKPLRIMTVHIAAPHVYLPPGWGLLLRRRQVRMLEPHLNGEDPTVLVGDFNATPRWPAYRRIVSCMSDAAIGAAQVQGKQLEPTWGPRVGGRRLLRIDHAFAHGVRPHDFHVAPIEGSDHAAIVLDLAGCDGR